MIQIILVRHGRTAWNKDKIFRGSKDIPLNDTGREEARRLVSEAARMAVKENRHLIDVLREGTDAPVDWEGLRDEAGYLGSAGAFIDQVLGEVTDEEERM